MDKHLSHTEIVGYWIDTKNHRDLMNHYQELRRQKFFDKENVHYPEDLTQAIKDNHELKESYLRKIHQAVADGDLKAETAIKNSTSKGGGWKVIPFSPTLLKGMENDCIIYEGREVYVQHMIHRDDFRAWLEQSGQWPLADGCSLAQWFETEQPVQKKKQTIKSEFDKRLDALKDWLIKLGYSIGDEVIILPKYYTKETIYTELCKEYGSLFLTIEQSSFYTHFWKKQKIVKLTRGNKSAIL